MKSFTPPLKTLPVFIEVAKNKSFSVAAKKLCVTHSAVSQSVKQLERYLGHALFKRDTHRVTLTKKGEIYFNDITVAINLIQEASKKQLQKDGNIFTVNVLTAVAYKWLIPRLSDFQEKHPDIDLRISTLGKRMTVEDFENHQIDIAIDYGKKGDWNNCYEEMFIEDSLILVGSPQLKLKSKNPMQIIKQAKCIFAKHELQQQMWRTWCAGANIAMPKSSSMMVFPNTLQAIQAAVSGLGVLAIHKTLVVDDLNTGQLIQLSPIEVKSDNAFFIVCPEDNMADSRAKAFVKWVIKSRREFFVPHH